MPGIRSNWPRKIRYASINRRNIGFAGLALLAALYCLPDHPSAGKAAILDAALHVLLFGAVTFAFARLVGSATVAVGTLAVLGALLEVIQWWIGGYLRIEVADIVANEIGVAVAALLLAIWSRRRTNALLK